MEYRKHPVFDCIHQKAGARSIRASLFTSARRQGIQRGQGIGRHLEPHPNLAELSGLLENDDAESTLGERKRTGQASNSAAGDENRQNVARTIDTIARVLKLWK